MLHDMASLPLSCLKFCLRWIAQLGLRYHLIPVPEKTSLNPADDVDFGIDASS